ncbi:MAG: alkaline phosphatase PhoX [Planctomycetota bacterium]
MVVHRQIALSWLAPRLCALAVGFGAGVSAQDPFPLPASTGSTPASAPFLLPAGTRQTLVTDLVSLRPQGVPVSFTDWDMVAIDPTNQHAFIPAETSRGAGILRYHFATGAATMLMLGDQTGRREPQVAQFDPAQDDFARFDPCTYTPWGTLITGEEATGGRFFEITNPHDATGPFQVVWHTSIPAVAHEGMRFDEHGWLYFIDEHSSGSIYRFVPSTPGDLSAGQVFVLAVDAFTGNPTRAWSDPANRGVPRVGAARWVPMTTPAGVPRTDTDPFVYVTKTSGRTAADQHNGTPYGRPEDLDVGRLANGNEILYVALTSENVVLGIELVDPSTCIVRQFCDYDTIDLATGGDINPRQNASNPYSGSGPFDNPDNLTVDAFGNVYVVEDNNPGDIWKCVDEDGDGVAESMGRFVSLGIAGAEPTGMIPDPSDPYRFYCCVQHPSSGNDALWAFDTRPYRGAGADLTLRSGVEQQTPNALPGELVKGMASGESVTVALRSDGGAFHLAPFVLLLQENAGFGLTSAAPTVWLDPSQPFYAILGGVARPALPERGASVTLPVPVSAAGLGLAFQAAALNEAGRCVFTDAHVVVVE